MVLGFTKQSGGHIEIDSELGKGTTMMLYFPRVPSPKQNINYPAEKTQIKGGSERILIAEDDILVLRNLEIQLISLGYSVTAVNNGPDALKALNESDLLLTDIIMSGGMNGRELAKLAQLTYPSLKVLFTSGYTEDAVVHEGCLEPGVALLNKPYSRLELATKLRRVLDS